MDYVRSVIKRKLCQWQFGLMCFFVILAPLWVSAETNVTYHLDSATSLPPGEFHARVIITGQDVLSLKDPRVQHSAYFNSELIAKELSRAAVNSRHNDQIIYSYVFRGRGELAPGVFALPDTSLQIGGKERKINWPEVHISLEPERMLIPFGVKQEVSTKNPYEGEQVVYAVKVTSPINSKKNDLNVVEIAGVWSEEFGDSSMRRTQIGETLALVGERRRAIFPLRTGRFRIPARSVSLELQVPKGSDSLIPQIGPRGTNADLAYDPQALLAEARKSSVPLESTIRRMSADGFEIQVRPIPQKPADAQRYIPVGEFHYQFNVSLSKSASGENALAILELEGDGNLRPLEIMPPSGSSDFEVFIGEPKLTTGEVAGRLVHKKRYEIVLVPKATGDLAVPRFAITTFDPKAERFERFVNEERTLHFQTGAPATLEIVRGITLSAQRVVVSERSLLSPRAVFWFLATPLVVVLLWSIVRLLGATEFSRSKVLALPRAREIIRDGVADDTQRILTQALAVYALSWLGRNEELALTPQESIELLRPFCPAADRTVDDLAAFFREVDRQQYGVGGAEKGEPPSGERLLELLKRLDDALVYTRRKAT